MYSIEQINFLKSKAGYIWWKSQDEALELPKRLIAQIMNIGVTSDVGELEVFFSPTELMEVVKTAESGQFDSKSWHFWHRRLGLTSFLDAVPPLPVRCLPS